MSFPHCEALRPPFAAHGLKGFLRSRRNFGDRDFSRVFVKKDKVGKCSARINRHSVLRHSFFRLSLKFRRFNSAAPLKKDKPCAIDLIFPEFRGKSSEQSPATGSATEFDVPKTLPAVIRSLSGRRHYVCGSQLRTDCVIAAVGRVSVTLKFKSVRARQARSPGRRSFDARRTPFVPGWSGNR